MLIKAGADVNAIKRGGGEDTAMACAAYFHQSTVVKLLLPYANLTSLNDALQVAARMGSVPIVTELLKAGVDGNVEVDGAHACCALAFACTRPHSEVVRLLLPLANQACLNNALHTAARYGHVKLAEQLLNAGAGINSVEVGVGPNGRTALCYACRGGHVDLVCFLMVKQADVHLGNPIHDAACQKCEEIIYLLLAKDKTLLETTAGYYDFTPLCTAVDNNQRSAVKAFLAVGARVNVTGIERAMAKRHKRLHPEITEALVQAGVRHRSLLQSCIHSGGCSPQVLETLLASGVDIHAIGLQKTSALFEAWDAQDCVALELLLDYGADISTINRCDNKYYKRNKPVHAEVLQQNPERFSRAEFYRLWRSHGGQHCPVPCL